MFVKKILSLLFCCLLLHVIQAQKTSFFKSVSTEIIAQAEGIMPGNLPKKFDAYQLDEAGLKTALESAPWELTAEAAQHKCRIDFPVAEGGVETFSVFRIAMMDAELAAAYPGIRTYAGVSMQNPRQTIRFSVTPRGFRAMELNTAFGAVLIKPLVALPDHYMVYKFQDAQLSTERGPTESVVLDGEEWAKQHKELFVPAAEDRDSEVPVKLKIYRYCAAAPGEFTQDHGGTKELALAAVTEYTNLVSAVYEQDMAIRLQLTNATQYVMFTDPNLDPYTQGPSVQDFAGQNTEVLTQYTNINSHDIGHVYIRYTGGAQGVGGVAVACSSGKGYGCSASNIDPNTGDYKDFFLVIIGQEIGHQLSGGHTWNRCGGGDGRSGITAFEPGSGSTIMSYGGLCGTDDYVGQSDLYFHSGSIEEIKNYATFTATCGSWLETGNNSPEVTLPYQDNFNIPISTPFELKGTATDADGDPLSYSWEEMDTGPETPLGQPQGSAAIFRSWPAVDVPNRVFPRMGTILANSSSSSEQLPTYTRDLNFRLTARDNKPGGGGVSWADVAFKAVDVAGPFLVTTANTAGTVWHIGELTRVTWDVANTNASPVNCQKVNIRLSKNGGSTFPITLVANTENDGSQYLLVPNELAPLARLRIEAADNVFFDVSNANFKIQAPTQPSLTVGLSADGSTICLPDNFTTVVNTATVLGYNTPVSLDLVGNVPPGAIASFSATNLIPGESSTLTLDLQSVAVEGNFSFTVRAISGTDTLLRPVSLSLRRNDFSGFALQTPINGLTGQALTQTLHWSKGLDADNYDVQFSDNPAFSTILASATATGLDSFKINFLLEKGKAYFWRVRPRNECGIHDWSEPFFFSTYAENCLTFNANDLPKSISSNGTPTVESKITVLQGGNISDLVISNIEGYHEYFKDLEAHLISPQGTDVLLWKDRCSNFNGNFNFGLSDASPTNFSCPPPSSGTIEKPQTPLAPIIGENSAGVWTLRIKDKVSTSGGSLSVFKLQFCQSVDIQPPFIVNNVVMPLPSGSNRTITPDFLLAEDPNNAHAQLTFTITTVPQHGILVKAGLGEMKPGDQFTQADIDNNQLQFFDFGFSTDPDGFRFVVSDGEGGFFGTPMFVAQPFVGTNEPEVNNIDFALFPNPAGTSVWLAFGQALESTARVSFFNLAGQLVRSENMALGQERLQIEVGQLPKGIYAVRVETRTGTGVRKLVVE